MKIILNKTIVISFLLLTSLLAKSQYLVRLTYYDFSAKIGYSTSIDFFRSTINDINVDNLLDRCSQNDSIFLNFGIPIIDPGYIPEKYGYVCNSIDTLNYSMDKLFTTDSITTFFMKSNKCSIELKILKIDGEFCVFRQLFPIYSHGPIFSYVGTIIKINTINSLNFNEIKTISKTISKN